ncbi:TPA: phage late control D family protein, partial [Escherichia coli]
MTDLLINVPSPDIEITINNNRLRNVTERLMTLSLTDNRGFEADRVTLTIDDADGQLQLAQRGARL